MIQSCIVNGIIRYRVVSCQEVKTREAVRQRFCQLAEQAGLREPAALADQLVLLMDEAFMSIGLYGRQSPAGQVAGAVERLHGADG